MAEQVAGTLITRNYSGFRGVDFSNRKDEIALTRSPDALNVWKNYKSNNGKCIETRPDIELLEEYSDAIFGLFFYEVNGTKHRIVHSGTKLYKDKQVIYSKMAENKSVFFIMNNILYIMDGTQYLRYNGTDLKEVEGYIPEVSISRSPSGGGVAFEDINLLTEVRKNSFCSDGASKEYILGVREITEDENGNLDKDYPIRVWVNNEEVLKGFKFVPDSGKVVFDEAPPEPLTPGADNVTIQFKVTNKEFRSRIEKCTLVEIFDNRVFFSGNPEHPNFIYFCNRENPEFIGTMDFTTDGTTDSKIMSLVSNNNAIWTMKEPGQNNTTIFYHNPSVEIDAKGYENKAYPSVHSSISTGCATTGINFNDTICFFSDRGLEAISGDITTEQALKHASSLIDNKLLNEDKYKDMMLQEWEGYLLVIVGNKIYLADSRAMVTINGDTEYEWFYWEFNNEITSTLVKDGVLYLCFKDIEKENGKEVIKYRIYTLTNTKDTRRVESYFCTLADEFKYPHYQKTTNKKGCVIDIEGSEVTVSTKVDNKEMTKINTYKNVKGYVVARIKKKKWKSIQLKFSSDKPFNLYSATLEAYVGSYVKR